MESLRPVALDLSLSKKKKKKKKQTIKILMIEANYWGCRARCCCVVVILLSFLAEISHMRTDHGEQQMFDIFLSLSILLWYHSGALFGGGEINR